MDDYKIVESSIAALTIVLEAPIIILRRCPVMDI
jgi:hypothetical protein